MLYNIIAAIGLVLIIEGILPFLAPHLWRRMVSAIAKQNDQALRISGLICMVVGLVVLVIAHIYI